jgi:hypothetical protein
VSTFTSVFNKQFNCDSCSKLFPKLPERLQEHQARLGCDGKVNPGLVFLPTHSMVGSPKVVYEECIGNFYSYRARELIRYLSKYRENINPYKGSYYEQPSKFVESMELVQNLYIQKETEQQQQMKKYGKRS